MNRITNWLSTEDPVRRSDSPYSIGFYYNSTNKSLVAELGPMSKHDFKRTSYTICLNKQEDTSRLSAHGKKI